MFTQVTPILAADDHQGIAAGAILARLDALASVTATLAKLTGNPGIRAERNLAGSADLAGAVAALPVDAACRFVTECDSIAAALTAGLIALEKARHAGQLNLSAARMLHDEASAAIASLHFGLLYSGSPGSAY